MKVPQSSLRGTIAKKTAGRLFVDREEPVALFRRTVAELPPDGVEMIVFYGMGGQGKTALCRHIRNLAGTEKNFSHLLTGMVDLRGRLDRNAAMSMLWVRNALAEGAGLTFPTFDIAFAAFWKESYPDQNLPTMTGRWIERIADISGDSAGSGADFLADMAGGVLQSIPFVGMAVRSLTGFAIRKTAETFIHAANEGLRHLYDDGKLLPTVEIERRLPFFLACDLATARLKNPDSRFLLLIDEYEGLLEGGGTTSTSKGSKADEAFRALVQECAALGMLFILFSRERLPWDRIDPAWHDAMTAAHHLLGGLGDVDADRFLADIPVHDPKIRKAMISGARARDPHSDAELVYPYMLDLQVDHFLAAQHAEQTVAPSDFMISDPDFVARRNELLRRFLKYCDDPLERTLKYLSVLRAFDRDAFAFAVRTFSTALPLDRFEDITSLSFVGPAAERADTYAFHGLIAEALQAAASTESNAETRKAFAQYLLDMARGGDQEGFGLRQVEALQEAIDLLLQVDWQLAASAFVKLYFDIDELSFFPKLVALGESLLSEMPEDFADPDCLSELFAAIGHGMRMTSDYDAALETLDQAEDVRDDHIKLRIGVARSGSLRAMGKMSAALEYGQALIARFAAKSLEAKSQTALAYLHSEMAISCHDLGRFTEAFQAIDRGEVLLESLPAEAIGRSGQLALANMAFMRIQWALSSDFMTKPDTIEAALGALDRIKSIFPDPATPEQLRTHLIYENLCGWALGQGQKNEDALVHKLNALDLARRLAEMQATATWDIDLATALTQLAQTQSLLKNDEAAAALAREAKALMLARPAFGLSPGMRTKIAATISFCAHFETSEQGLEDLAMCIALFKDLVDEADVDEKHIYLRRLAETLRGKAAVLHRSGNAAAALEALQEAEAIWTDIEKTLPLSAIKWDLARTLVFLRDINNDIGDTSENKKWNKQSTIIAYGNSSQLDPIWEDVIQDEDFLNFSDHLAQNGFHKKTQALEALLAVLEISEIFSGLYTLFRKSGAKVIVSNTPNAFCNATRSGDLVLSFGGMSMPHPKLVWDFMTIIAERAIWTHGSSSGSKDEFFPDIALGQERSVELLREVTVHSKLYATFAAYELRKIGLGGMVLKFTDYASVYEAYLRDLAEAGKLDVDEPPEPDPASAVAEHIAKFYEDVMSKYFDLSSGLIYQTEH